ncbi:hypothetical protein J2X68_001162 [Streptomyces sp. 3330]|uniref:hypothetical protein n=1 Tax=Streptomyces sp. 3330 TaxID=2817755 RepID=UPI002859C1FF|nr:hypothetical protein [Streptomyces sp. 3330]MDR6974484.1 hypothetical protein [Streptomyces sp. 3330]
MQNAEGRSSEYSVWGTIELRPPVPVARLWDLTVQDAFQDGRDTVRQRATEPEPAAAARTWWEFVPDDDAGTDDLGRPRAVKYLRVDAQGVARAEVDSRLRDVAASIGPDHAFHGHLTYEGWVGDDGEIWLHSGDSRPEWRDTTPRYW